MTEHGEKRILRAIRTLGFRAGFLRRLVKPRIIERERGPMRQFFREGKFVGTADPPRARIDHHDRAQNAILRAKRDRNKRLGGQGTKPIAVGLFRKDFAQLAIVNVADHLRPSCAQHVRAGFLRGFAGRKFLGQFLQRRLFGRIAVRDSDVMHCAVFFRRKDNTKIGDPRHNQRGQIAECLLVIERAAENVAGIGEKGEPFLARFRFSSRRLFANEFLAFFRLSFYLLGFSKKIDKDRDLRPQNFRNNRRKNVIDRADRVTTRDVRLRVVYRADENDRRRLGAWALPNQRRRFEAVHHRHIHVEQDHREILFEQTTQRLLSRTRADDILFQVGENRFVGQHLVGSIVDNQDADLLLGRLLRAGISGHDQRCSQLRSSVRRRSLSTGLEM